MKKRCRKINNRDDSDRKMKRALRNLEKQFEKEGPAAIENARINNPVEYLYAIAAAGGS